MEAEKLKIIAEGMGYEVITTKFGYVEIGFKANGAKKLYEPDTTNNDQNSELEEKLKINTRPILDFWVASVRNGTTSKGKTPREARCNAAYEYFKGEK